MNQERIAALVRELLIELGEDPDREGLLKTPERVARAMEFLTSGYRQDIDTIINGAPDLDDMLLDSVVVTVL